METKIEVLSLTHKKRGLGVQIYKSRYLLLLFLPTLLYYILFRYLPMWGLLISFQDYKPFIGMRGSNWVGLKHYINFFNSPDCFKIIKNTFLLGIYSLLWGFPVPIIFALILNEVKNKGFKKVTQTISYMPHFLSTVVVCGMLLSFLSPIRGMINNIIVSFGGQSINFLGSAKYFRTIYVASDIWQSMGWGAIIYLAALAGIDPQYYEAAMLDGATKFKQIIYITLPCLAPTIITMFLLRMGSVLEVGLEKILLLYSPSIYATADVISTYVYRQGLVSTNFSYASAVGLFNSLVNLALLFTANYVTKKVFESSLF